MTEKAMPRRIQSRLQTRPGIHIELTLFRSVNRNSNSINYQHVSPHSFDNDEYFQSTHTVVSAKGTTVGPRYSVRPPSSPIRIQPNKANQMNRTTNAEYHQHIRRSQRR